jgi:hypothetical protein
MERSPTEVPLWQRSMVLVRQSRGHQAAPLQRLVQACAAFSERTTFRFRSRGRGLTPFSGTSAEIEQMLAEELRARGRGRDAPFVLATDRHDPLLILSYLRDPFTPSRPHYKVEISFSLERPLVGPGGHFTFDELGALFATCISGYQAATGAIYDSQLLEIVRSTVTREAMMQQLPPKEYQYIPVSPAVQAVPRSLVERLARIRHFMTFDITGVPEAVFWINYWGPQQLVSVGEHRIRAAPWAFIAPHPDGGLILASQCEAFDALNPDHLERLANIADAIDLYTVQGESRKRR